MKLYSAPGSCSMAAHICLLEAGVDFSLVKLSLAGNRQLPDGRHLSDINPKGYVPVLELDNGEYLTENIALLQYIADQNPAAQLAPASGTLARYRLQEWLGFINSEVHKTLGLLFNPVFEQQVRGAIQDKFSPRAAYLDKHLSQHDYLMGQQFTVADAYLYVVLSWCPHLAVDLAPYPALQAYLAHIATRDAVKNVQGAH
ncbi:glutathione binding-like protein [Oceanisphaera sp. W20_SRM_FM3]|uniref:glutathione binding-like protein n=1 Tax=Oceanisphaera sp. W20_SRM_FM3 TaxID=3240267 RepID=UPI003F9E385D